MTLRLRHLAKSKKGRLVIWGIILIIIASTTLFYWQARQETLTKNTVAPEDKCQQTADVTFGCYKNQLGQIIRESGPEPAFALLKQQYEPVPMVKSQCHQLVHIVGRETYAKYGDLSNTFTQGDSFCWSGYYHGVMEELSQENGEETTKIANSICADLRIEDRGSFKHYNCVHGLGHGFMFILKQDLFKSLKACDVLTDTYESSSCYGGVFMQNIMNNQTPDRELGYVSPYLKDDEPMYPCTVVEDKQKQQCYLMQTSHALAVVNYDFKKVFDLCDKVEENYRNTCYQSLGRDASGSTVSDPVQTKSKCLLGGNLNAQNNCIIGAVKDFVSYYHSDTQAKQFCDSLAGDLSGICISTMDSYYASF